MKAKTFDSAAALAVALDDDRCEAAVGESADQYGQPFSRCFAPAGNRALLERFPRSELTPKLHYVRVCDTHDHPDEEITHWLRPVLPVMGEAIKHCPCGRWLGRIELVDR